MVLHGVGLDLVDVERFARLIDRRGDAFVTRWFTEAERHDCAETDSPAGAYAVRFAVKEAVWKSLGLDGRAGPLPWRDISATPGSPAGAWLVELDGAVAAAAAQRHVTTIACTASVQGRIATAVAHAYRAVAEPLSR